MLCPNGMQGAAKCSGVMRYGRFQPSTHLENIKTKRLRTLNLFFFSCADVCVWTPTRQRCDLSELRGQRL